MRRFALLLLFLLTPALARAECFDVSKPEPAELSGILSFRIFAGPPGYADVQQGDTPEPGYVLKLSSPICLTGDADFTDPSFMFDEVQLVPREATAGAMKALDGRAVTVKLSDHIPAHTGHHHRPLVAWVDGIAADKDITEEYGTAASTVRAFYLALGAGDGKTAASFVVAEKTRKGPLSAKELSRFYGSLSEPLELLSLDDAGRGRFEVRYRYLAGSGRCEGSATVRTKERRGRFYIEGIKAHDGC